MISYRCDGCGKEMRKGDLRYTVKIDVRAAYDEIEVSLADLVRDHRAELVALIERMKERQQREIEESVYKAFQLDLCPACQRAYLRDPLHLRKDPDAKATVDVDAFLRSLGIPQAESDGDE